MAFHRLAIVCSDAAPYRSSLTGNPLSEMFVLRPSLTPSLAAPKGGTVTGPNTSDRGYSRRGCGSSVFSCQLSGTSAMSSTTMSSCTMPLRNLCRRHPAPAAAAAPAGADSTTRVLPPNIMLPSHPATCPIACALVTWALWATCMPRLSSWTQCQGKTAGPAAIYDPLAKHWLQ